MDQNEELVPAWRAILASGSVRTQDTPPDELLGRELLEAYSSSLTRMAVAGARQLLPKISVIAHLALDQDVHPTNMGIIRNISTGAIHIAPFFDFDRTFGLSEPATMTFACRNPKLAVFSS